MEITIQNEYLTKLTPNDAVDLVRNLVQADAKESGIPLNKISFPSAINTPDGGIDGKVDGAVKDSEQGTIKKGLTCYQIKTGDYHINKQGIKRLFYDKKGELKPKIKHCLENGTLIIVLTGQDRPIDIELEKIYKQLEHLEHKPSIEIWAQNTLIGYLKRYPILCLTTLKIQDNSFNFYDGWAGQADMRHEMVPAPKQDEFIEGLRERLQPEAPAEHIRVTGEHGIGKTRLVLEALRPKELARLCIYARDPKKFMDSPLFQYLSARNDGIHAILVADDCSEEHMEDIWRQISNHGNRIKLVTIYDKSGPSRHHMESLPAPTLDDTQIRQILESYVEPQYKADIWYKECRHSPYAAHIIGENLRSNPEDTLRQTGASGWDRFIAYRNSITGEEFARRKTILLWIGQLRQFGYGSTYASEHNIVADKIKKYEGIERGVFARTVKELIDMGILRGSDILHIEPNALHAWLWREWHRKHGSSPEPFSLDDMWKRAKSDNAYKHVLEWHVDMWQYDEVGSPHHDAVKHVFSHDGFAAKHSLLDSYDGAELLYKMAKASPKDAVEYLERYVGALGMDGLRQFGVGRWRAASILAEAAGCNSLFRRAARVLLLLAGTGSQEGDDTDSMFARLFLPAAGPVGWTETPPVERVPILKEALTHPITGCRLTGIKACEAALQTNGFVKGIAPDEAWQRGGVWEPTRWAEYTEYYRKVLHTVRVSLKDLDEPEQRQLSKVVLSCTRFLLKFAEQHDTELRDDVLSVLYKMHDGRHAAPVLMIETVSDCLSYGSDDMAADLRDKLRLLHDRIVGGSYHGLMRRHIAMNVFSDIETPNDERRETVEALAKQSFDNPEALKQEMAWLVTDEAAHGHGFGYALGKIDDGSMFADIRDAQRQCPKSGATFLGGYLNAVFDRDMSEWERLMDSLAADATLHELVPALTHMSGMTDKAAVRILELIESKVDPLALRVFKFGTLVCKVPEHVFQKWLGLLVGGNTEAYEVALELYHRYYMRGKQHISDSVSELLFPRNDSYRIRHSSGYAKYFWSKILASYVAQGAVTGDVISNVVDTVLTIDAHSILDTELIPALEAVTEHHPDKTWEAISVLIDPDKNPPTHTRMNVMYAFSVNKTLVEKITPAVMCGWIDRDVERRAVIVAGLLSHDIKAAAEYAAKYGEVNDVKKALINPLWESYSGSRAEYYKGKIKAVDSLLAVENRPIVREFLEEYRDALSERCKDA